MKYLKYQLQNPAVIALIDGIAFLFSLIGISFLILVLKFI